VNNAFRTVLGVQLSLATLIVAHATFCIVVVFNNVIARLRPARRRLEEASMDLVPTASRHSGRITFPLLRRHCWPADCWPSHELRRNHRDPVYRQPIDDDIAIWILDNLFRPNQAPIVNVVATVLVIASISRNLHRNACPAIPRAAASSPGSAAARRRSAMRFPPLTYSPRLMCAGRSDWSTVDELPLFGRRRSFRQEGLDRHGRQASQMRVRSSLCRPRALPHRHRVRHMRAEHMPQVPPAPVVQRGAAKRG